MPRINQIDHYTNFIQDQMTPGKFGSAEFLTIAAGPPLLSTEDLAGGGSNEVVFPIGIVQNFNLSQNMAIARVFEIGSKRSYMFPGKVVGAVSFGRPYYHAHSLLRLLMAVHSSSNAHGVEFPPVFTNAFGGSKDVHIPPGWGVFFVNLASDLFTQPHGELIIMRDTQSKIIQTFYLEQCYIPAHTLACDAQGIIWQEAVQVQYERLVPVKVSGMLDTSSEPYLDPKQVFDNDNAIVPPSANFNPNG